MSALARNTYIPLVDRESGYKTCSIWLLTNPKYPAVVNDIWKHVLDEIQDKVYREIQARIDTTNIYIRSVVGDCGIVPDTLNWWGKEVVEEIRVFREILLEHNPKMLISFGAFPYEFLRRVLEIKPEKGPKYWRSSILRDEFDRSIGNFNVDQANRIPLLRRVITSDKFQETHGEFSPNDKEQYIKDVGSKVADLIIQNIDSFNIWIK